MAALQLQSPIKKAKPTPKRKAVPSTNTTEDSAPAPAPSNSKQKNVTSNPPTPVLTPSQIEEASSYPLATVIWPWAVRPFSQICLHCLFIPFRQLKRDFDDREHNHPFKALDLVQATSMLRRLQIMKCYVPLRLSRDDSTAEISRKFIQGINMHLQEQSIILSPPPIRKTPPA